MFEARLSASYGKKQVLRDIRFCLPEGVTAASRGRSPLKAA